MVKEPTCGYLPVHVVLVHANSEKAIHIATSVLPLSAWMFGKLWIAEEPSKTPGSSMASEIMSITS